MAKVSTEMVALGDVELSVTTSGSGPLVVLLHGFPELAYSWRHQIGALAEAGFHVVAPDQRGYGRSTSDLGVDDYTIHHLVGDVVGLVNHYDVDDFVVVGHDWGALVATHCALMVPQRVRGLATISVPILPPLNASVLDIVDAQRAGSFHYMRYFQTPGVAEVELDGDPIGFLRALYWSASGDRPINMVGPDPATQTTFVGDLAIPAGLPQWLSSGDFEAFARAFMSSGFTGPLNWYRNLHRNWELTAAWRGRTIDVPTAFVGGLADFVVNGGTPGVAGRGVDLMGAMCTDLRSVTLLDNIGHWTQQEAPGEVNEALLAFLAGL